MKKMMSIIWLLFMIIPRGELDAQASEQTIRSANDLYQKGNYGRAADEYRNAFPDGRARFNYGNALYRQDKKSEAVAVFDELGHAGKETGLRARAYYNKGAIYSASGKLEESIEAYKNTLRMDPDDQLARENLQKALLELKKKKLPPKKEPPPPSPPKKSPPKINPRQANQKLKQLQQKEKETQQRVQKKTQPVNTQVKDW